MERFWEKVEKTDGCWLWLASCNNHGYGQIKISGRVLLAHRVSWKMHFGDMPPGLVLDHLCRNRKCVNPDHLELVTDRVNILRGVGFSAINAKKTCCKRGHEFTVENTYVRSSGKRLCRVCGRDGKRNTYWVGRIRQRALSCGG